METENNRRVYNGERMLKPTDLIEGEPIAERIVRMTAEIREGWTPLVRSQRATETVKQVETLFTRYVGPPCGG